MRANVIGAVRPASGQIFSMIFDGVDTNVFQAYLDHLAQTVPPLPGKRRIPHPRQRQLAQIQSLELPSLRMRVTVPTSIPSNGSGCDSKSTASSEEFA